MSFNDKNSTFRNMAPRKLKTSDYHVAWLALVADFELLPSRLMLDEEHGAPDYDTKYDDNVYTFGRMAGHNVVIATCPPGLTGNVNAGRVSGPMFKTFSGIRMAVLVGIGGGMPAPKPSDDPTQNVHLGNIVVGWPGDGGPACVHYDAGRIHAKGQFEMVGTIDRPDRELLNALGKLVVDHEMGRSTFEDHRKHLLRAKHEQKFVYPGTDQDRLFKATYQHSSHYRNDCTSCDTAQLVRRPARNPEDAARLIFH